MQMSQDVRLDNLEDANYRYLIARARHFKRKAMMTLVGDVFGSHCEYSASHNYFTFTGRGLPGLDFVKAAKMFDNAARLYYQAGSWKVAGEMYVNTAKCHLEMHSRYDAAKSYVDAANCYKVILTDLETTLLCFQRSVDCFLAIGIHNMPARYYKEMAELVHNVNRERAITYYEKSASLFLRELTTSARQCIQEIAEYFAHCEEYQKSIDIFEEMAQQSLNNDSLKDGVKGHLLNAGLCEFCKCGGDILAMNKALERWQEMDPTFSGTLEYKLLEDFAAALAGKKDLLTVANEKRDILAKWNWDLVLHIAAFSDEYQI